MFITAYNTPEVVAITDIVVFTRTQRRLPHTPLPGLYLTSHLHFTFADTLALPPASHCFLGFTIPGLDTRYTVRMVSLEYLSTTFGVRWCLCTPAAATLSVLNSSSRAPLRWIFGTFGRYTPTTLRWVIPTPTTHHPTPHTRLPFGIQFLIHPRL